MRRTANKRTAEKILWVENIGFSFLILFSWLDELIGLPHLLFGSPVYPNWRESAMESIAISFVWLIVYGSTRRILRRFRYLEDTLLMCAWCRKLQRGADWVSLEDYCVRELGVDISRGICPQCGRNTVNKKPIETR
jgi:hypothetical protein